MTREKYKILVTASDRFLKTGFRKVSMDNLAREMRISKKTFYKHFSSKTEIIESIVSGVKLNFSRSLKKVTESGESPIQKLIGIGDVVVNLINRISFEWQRDLKNSYSNLWKEYESYRISELDNSVKNVIDEGIEEELFNDINAQLFSSMIYSSLRDISKSRDSSIETEHCMSILIIGVLSSKGRNEFENFPQMIS